MVAAIQRERPPVGLRESAGITDGARRLARERADGLLGRDALAARDLAAQLGDGGARDARHGMNQGVRWTVWPTLHGLQLPRRSSPLRTLGWQPMAGN